MISIVIPTINEEKNILLTINKLSNLKNLNNPEIIIVDDNSTDNTVNIINDFIQKKKLDIKLIRNYSNLGLGYALKLGYENSKYKFVMFLDADLSVKNDDINALFESRKENHIIIGSRYLTKSKVVNVNKIKFFLSLILNKLVSIIFKLNIIDISHSFRIICKNFKLSVKNYTHPGFFWELTLDAKKKGIFLKEIPITFLERENGISKNKTIKMIKSVVNSLHNIFKM
jgi:dolichol-phosphate mannosyltransferase